MILGFVVQYWPVFLGVLVVVLIVELIVAYQAEIAAQREAEAVRQARLIANADEQHRLVQEGDVAGIFGDYPVPEDLRGVGIWLAG